MKTQPTFIRAVDNQPPPPPGFEHWRLDGSGQLWFRAVQRDNSGSFPTICGIPHKVQPRLGGIVDRMRGWIFS